MYCSYQYLSIDPKKVCHAHKMPTNLKKSLDISETIKDRELGPQI